MSRSTERDEFGNANIIEVDNAEFQLSLDFDDFNRVTNALNKLAEYEDLEEQGKLLKLPCAVGDFALLVIGVILPVNYISKTQNGIEVGLQNGTSVQINRDFPAFCKGFYKTKEEAETALQKMK